MSGSIDHIRAATGPQDHPVEEHEWGRLVWMVNRALGMSETLTVGRCYINPGQSNPRHVHPNCSEVLYLVSGTLEHSLGDERFPMTAGDVVTIPRGVTHNARNVGDGVAEMVICYDSADRQTEGE